MAINTITSKNRVKGHSDCTYCGGVGIIPPGTRAVRICECVARASDTLEGMSRQLAAKIQRLHPDWKHKMDVYATARGVRSLRVRAWLADEHAG
jgi:hypothetical protein